MRRLTCLLLAALLTACTPKPQAADPAIWEVKGPAGQHGWLFGTIHALERPALWRTDAVDRALDQSDAVMVEIADLDHGTAQAFARLSRTPGQPSLSSRVSPQLRGKLAKLLAEGGFRESRFDAVETWAAALMLARAEDGEMKSVYGIDRAVLKAAQGKRVIELEGASGQLSLFDSLPEREQRDLLDAVVADSGSLQGESPGLADAWLKGDMARIEAETTRGLLADPELRAVIFTGRNRDWSDRLARLMEQGAHPFVAVGSAHMAGPEGLPVLLAQKGYTVTRIR